MYACLGIHTLLIHCLMAMFATKNVLWIPMFDRTNLLLLVVIQQVEQNPMVLCVSNWICDLRIRQQWNPGVPRNSKKRTPQFNNSLVRFSQPQSFRPKPYFRLTRAHFHVKSMILGLHQVPPGAQRVPGRGIALWRGLRSWNHWI